MKTVKAGLFFLAAFFALIFIVEGVLSAACILFPRAEMILSRSNPLLIKDETLLWKGNPRIPGHDKSGFRNPAVLKTADVGVLGDSQTYGFGLDGEFAWPEQMKENGGLSVYSFALPGYGPIQQLTLIDRALSLKPKKIIYALYTGNDFYESYAAVYDSGKRADLKTPGPETARAISEAENRRPLLEEIKFRENACTAMGRPVSRGGVRGFLAVHSKTYGLVRALCRILKAREQGVSPSVGAAGKSESECLPFESGPLKTFFTPAYRLTGLDRNDPRIEEGFQITLRAIREISEKARNSNVNFLVLVIPTKESVLYKKALAQKGALPEEYQNLASGEAFYLEKIETFLRREKIEYKNLLPAFENAAESGIQAYFNSSDNHLNEAGQRLTAKAAREWAASIILSENRKVG